MDYVQQPHSKKKNSERNRRTPDAQRASSSFSMNLLLPLPLTSTLSTQSVLSFSLFSPSPTLSPKLLSVFSPPHHRSHPPTPLFPLKPGSDFILPAFSLSYPAVSSSPPTILSAVVLLSPSPPHWASLGDAEGLSLSLSPSSLFACLRLTGSVAEEASCLYISLSLFLSLHPPPHTHTALRCLLSSFFLPPTPSHCSNSLSQFPSSLPFSVSSPCYSSLI